MEMKNISEHKVYNIIKVKNKYSFRVLLRFDDGTEEIRQFSGFDSKKDANSEKEKIIAQLVTKTFIVPKKQSVSRFLFLKALQRTSHCLKMWRKMLIIQD